jgi:hypothetical protein
MLEANDALYAVMFSPVSTKRRRRRLRSLRRLYEERLTEAEAELIEVRASLALIDRVLSDYEADA